MTVLRGGEVVDGTGSPPRRADVEFHDGVITAVEPSLTSSDDDVIDVSGLVVAPGFIDCHTHYDAQVLWDPDLTPSSWHGVTTVVIGNCGFGIAPTPEDAREIIARTLENVEGMSLEALLAGIPWTFESFPEYLNAVEQARPRLNVAAMIGHTPLRLSVMGSDAMERVATDEEIKTMRQVVVEALDAGAVGFASSRQPAHAGAWGRPVPSRLASIRELEEISGALRERQRGILAITRGPDYDQAELAHLSRITGRPVTWTALMATQGGPNAAAAVEAGDRLGGQVWPQVACRPVVFQATLAEPAPFARIPAFAEVLSVGTADRDQFYQDPQWRRRAQEESDRHWPGLWDRVFVAETGRHSALIGGPALGRIAEERGTSAVDVLCQVALDDDLATRFEVVIANDDDASIAGLLNDDRTLLGLADSGAHASQLCDAVFATHLLGHWVRDAGALSIEKAVWKLTGQPATVFSLHRRGRLAPRFNADIVAFDAATIGPAPVERVWDLPAGADRLVAQSHGIHYVWVNGELIQAASGPTECRPGQVIRDSGA